MRSDTSASEKFLHLSIVMGCLCLAAVLRMSNYEFVFSNITGHMNFIDTDCYYYMRRLVYFIGHFPDPLIFDPLEDWPVGSMVDWPEGFLVLIGLPLKILGVTSMRGLELGACLEVVFIGVLMCLVIYFAAKKILNNSSTALLVLFLSAVNFLLIRYTCLGQFDHEGMEAFFPALMLWMLIPAFEERKTWVAICFGAMMAYSFSISSSSFFYTGTFFAIYACILGDRKNRKQFFLTIVTFALLLTPYILWNVSVGRSPRSVNYPSFFHLLLVLGLAGASYICMLFRKKLPIVIAACLLVFTPLYFLGWPAVVMAPLAEAFNYVFGHAGVLSNVSEAAPLFMNFGQIELGFMHLNFGYFIYLLPLSWLLLLFWKRLSTREKILLLTLSLLSIPGLCQKRFSQEMMAPYLIFLGWLLTRCLDWFKKMDLRIGPVFLFFFFSLMTLPMLRFGISPGPTTRDRVDLGTTAMLLKNLNLDEKLVVDRLNLRVPVTEGIWANPNLGNMLEYITGLGVVTNSFYHWNSFNLDFDLRLATSDDDFNALLKKNRIKYQLIANDFKFFELQHHLRSKSVSYFVETKMLENGPAIIYNMPELEKFAWVRHITHEYSEPKFKVLFSLQFPEYHFYSFMRGLEFQGL